MGKRVVKERCNRIRNRYQKQRERENIPKKKKGKQTRITDFFTNNCDPDISIEVVNERGMSIEFFQINHQKRTCISSKACSIIFSGSSKPLRILLRLDFATLWKRSNKFMCKAVVDLAKVGVASWVPTKAVRPPPRVVVVVVKAWAVVAARARVVANVNRTMFLFSSQCDE